MLQFYALVAAFHDAIGNQKRCEAAYVQYILLTEQLYSSISLESSNAYFLVGVYYFEQ